MIRINMDKAKNIAHDMRRKLREEEFKPYDEVVMKQIPGKSAQEAEAARAAIREKYANIQAEIEVAQTTDELKNILGL